MTEPWPDLRHSMSHLTVLIENPGWPRTRPGNDGGRYVEAELDLPHARRFQADVNRRMQDLERADEPTITDDDDYDTLYAQYKDHLQKVYAYQREHAQRFRDLEHRTLLFQKYLQPHWDRLAAAEEA